MKEYVQDNPIISTGNRMVMVAWINQDLIRNASCDVDDSIVFLDEHGEFVYALPVGVPLPDADTLANLERVSSIRYWSKGV